MHGTYMHSSRILTKKVFPVDNPSAIPLTEIPLTDVMYQVVWPAATAPRAPSLGSAERAQLLL